MTEMEEILLSGKGLDGLPDDTPWLEELKTGNYLSIIETLTKRMFSSPGSIDQLVTHLESGSESEVLILGISALQVFIQCNWTGHKYDNECVKPLLVHYLPESSDDIHLAFRKCLIVDGEETIETIFHPELIILAEACFRTNSKLESQKWWLMRALFIHQQFIDEYCTSLTDELTRLSAELKSSILIKSQYLNVLLSLETARIFLYYGKVMLSEEEVKNVLKLLDMEVELIGALGKRTQHQQKDVAQLMLKIKSIIIEDQQISKYLPKDISLNDDTRLPKVVFKNFEVYPDLPPVQQAVIMLLSMQKKTSEAKDELQNEELLPYVNCLLAYPKIWSLQLSALTLRSIMERGHRRTVERSLLQLQELMELKHEEFDPENFQLFYCSYALPHYSISLKCATLLLTVGSVKSALEIYFNLKKWQKVITCYNLLNLRHKAEEVIREQMAKGETVKLWCSLGDATDDESCYEKAWVLSNMRSAQAQRHWGFYYYFRKQYKECIPHFKKSLEINSCQTGLWFALGFATLTEVKLEECVSAYRRFCTLEPDNFEAWNNLAKAYVLLGHKERASNALKEALKCNYEIWQVWDNLMVVSLECKDYEEVIRSYHRLLDLKGKHVDVVVLTNLVSAIIQGQNDCYNKSASLLKKKTLELFGRITSKVLDSPTIWFLYGDLTKSLEEQNKLTISKYTQYYQNAHSAIMQEEWCKDDNTVRKVMHVCERVVDAKISFAKLAKTTEALQALNSAKFSINNLLAKVEKYIELSNLETIPDLVKDMDSLKDLKETLQKEIDRLKNSP